MSFINRCIILGKPVTNVCNSTVKAMTSFLLSGARDHTKRSRSIGAAEILRPSIVFLQQRQPNHQPFKSQTNYPHLRGKITNIPSQVIIPLWHLVSTTVSLALLCNPSPISCSISRHATNCFR